MPFKIACPAGHKLVIAGNGPAGPLVCPRCGLPAMPDLAGMENPVAGEVEAPESACAKLVDVEAGARDVPTVCEKDAPPAAGVTKEPSRLPVIRVQPKANGKRPWKPGPGAVGGVLVMAALASMTPAVGELVAAFPNSGAAPDSLPARWALLLAWLALMQTAYGAYCWLWADWSSWRMATAAIVLQTGIYAALLAVILLADPYGWILGERGLQLTAALADGKAALVCLTLICLCAVLALFAGRQSMRGRAMEVRPRTRRAQGTL